MCPQTPSSGIRNPLPKFLPTPLSNYIDSILYCLYLVCMPVCTYTHAHVWQEKNMKPAWSFGLSEKINVRRFLLHEDASIRAQTIAPLCWRSKCGVNRSRVSPPVFHSFVKNICVIVNPGMHWRACQAWKMTRPCMAESMIVLKCTYFWTWHV